MDWSEYSVQCIMIVNNYNNIMIHDNISNVSLFDIFSSCLNYSTNYKAKEVLKFRGICLYFVYFMQKTAIFIDLCALRWSMYCIIIHYRSKLIIITIYLHFFLDIYRNWLLFCFQMMINYVVFMMKNEIKICKCQKNVLENLKKVMEIPP